MGSRYSTGSGGLRDSARNVAEGAQSYLNEGYERVEDVVSNHPGTSALVVFGLGLGVGILIGTAIAASREETTMQSVKSMTSNWLDRRQAEKLGRRVLDSIADYLPSSIADRIS